MADSGKAGKGGWTDAEKYSLLLQIIKQVGGDKISVKFDQINLPGRTPKAMTHVWAKIRSEVTESGGDDGGAAAVAKTRKPAKNKAKLNADGEGPPPKKNKVVPKKQENEDEDEAADSEDQA